MEILLSTIPWANTDRLKSWSLRGDSLIWVCLSSSHEFFKTLLLNIVIKKKYTYIHFTHTHTPLKLKQSRRVLWRLPWNVIYFLQQNLGKSCQEKWNMSRGFPSCWAETCSSHSENFFLIPWRPFLYADMGSALCKLHSVAQDEYSTYWEPEEAGIPYLPFRKALLR